MRRRRGRRQRKERMAAPSRRSSSEGISFFTCYLSCPVRLLHTRARHHTRATLEKTASTARSRSVVRLYALLRPSSRRPHRTGNPQTSVRLCPHRVPVTYSHTPTLMIRDRSASTVLSLLRARHGPLRRRIRRRAKAPFLPPRRVVEDIRAVHVEHRLARSSHRTRRRRHDGRF